MKFEESNAAVVVNSANGIYIAQTFAEYFEKFLRHPDSKLSLEKVDILLAGPDNEEYIEVFADLFPITLSDDNGKEFVFFQYGDGDVWELSKEDYEQIEWEEI